MVKVSVRRAPTPSDVSPSYPSNPSLLQSKIFPNEETEKVHPSDDEPEAEEGGAAGLNESTATMTAPVGAEGSPAAASRDAATAVADVVAEEKNACIAANAADDEEQKRAEAAGAEEADVGSTAVTEGFVFSDNLSIRPTGERLSYCSTPADTPRLLPGDDAEDGTGPRRRRAWGTPPATGRRSVTLVGPVTEAYEGEDGAVAVAVPVADSPSAAPAEEDAAPAPRKDAELLEEGPQEGPTCDDAETSAPVAARTPDARTRRVSLSRIALAAGAAQSAAPSSFGDAASMIKRRLSLSAHSAGRASTARASQATLNIVETEATPEEIMRHRVRTPASRSRVFLDLSPPRSACAGGRCAALAC